MRKNIIVFFIVAMFLVLSYYDKRNESVNKKDIIVYNNKNKENYTQKVNIIYKNKKFNLNLENYVVGVVACEMPASFDIEALKAMSIAARTFALYKIKTNKNYVLSTTTKDQCYINESQMKKNWGSKYNKNYNKIKKAVSDTENMYMTYKDKIIISFYFSISNGYTENCEDVFSQKLDYLRSVDSSWDKKYSYKEKSVKYTVKDFLKKLNINSDSIKSINIKKNKTNRAEYVYINNKKYKGTVFRKKLGLRSTDIEINIKDNYVYIKTKGYGHGVGMSQYGANEMAKNGFKYDEILKYYYKGINIMNKL